MLSAAGDKVKDLAGSAKEALSSATGKVGDAADWTKEHASELGHEVADRASSMGHEVAHRASALRGQAKQKARSARLGFWQTMEENPLMVGAAVLALGVIAGLAVPSTDKEDELMGETRDRLLDDVKEAGQQALDKGKHVAEAVADKVKEEARNQGLTAEGVVDKVKNVAREATNTVKEEAKRQNLTPEAALNAIKPAQPQGSTRPGERRGPRAGARQAVVRSGGRPRGAALTSFRLSSATMTIQRIEPGPGQESVWDYPRPPALEDSSRHIEVRFNGVTIADTRRAKRVLETSHPRSTTFLPKTSAWNFCKRIRGRPGASGRGWPATTTSRSTANARSWRPGTTRCRRGSTSR